MAWKRIELMFWPVLRGSGGVGVDGQQWSATCTPHHPRYCGWRTLRGVVRGDSGWGVVVGLAPIFLPISAITYTRRSHGRGSVAVGGASGLGRVACDTPDLLVPYGCPFPVPSRCESQSPIRPVLKHGPGSLTHARVIERKTQRRRETDTNVGWENNQRPRTTTMGRHPPRCAL